jgi:hypothetical protein
VSKKLAITLALLLGLGVAAAPTIHRRLRLPRASVPAIPVAVAESRSGERIVSDGIAVEFSAEVVSPDSSRRAGTPGRGRRPSASGSPTRAGAHRRGRPAARVDRRPGPADGKKPKNCPAGSRPSAAAISRPS